MWLEELGLHKNRRGIEALIRSVDQPCQHDDTMFFWPLVGAVALDGLALFVATNDIAPSLMLVSFMGIRLLFLMLFAAVFYRQR